MRRRGRGGHLLAASQCCGGRGGGRQLLPSIVTGVICDFGHAHAARAGTMQSEFLDFSQSPTSRLPSTGAPVVDYDGGPHASPAAMTTRLDRHRHRRVHGPPTASHAHARALHDRRSGHRQRRRVHPAPGFRTRASCTRTDRIHRTTPSSRSPRHSRASGSHSPRLSPTGLLSLVGVTPGTVTMHSFRHGGAEHAWHRRVKLGLGRRFRHRLGLLLCELVLCRPLRRGLGRRRVGHSLGLRGEVGLRLLLLALKLGLLEAFLVARHSCDLQLRHWILSCSPSALPVRLSAAAPVSLTALSSFLTNCSCFSRVALSRARCCSARASLS